MNWKETEKSLEVELKFKDFRRAFSFMAEVAIEAERMNHHPTWTNTYNTVSFILQTHDSGYTVTDKDRKLAKKIEEVYKNYES